MASDVLVAGLLGGAKAFSDEYDRMSEEQADIRAEQRRIRAEKLRMDYAEKIRREGDAYDIKVEQGLIQTNMLPEMMQDDVNYEKKFAREQREYERNIQRLEARRSEEQVKEEQDYRTLEERYASGGGKDVLKADALAASAVRILRNWGGRV